MGDAKRIEVKPIAASDARKLVRKWHYSGKVVNNSQVHLGAFLDGRCGGVMQFGPSLDKRKLVGLVRGTLWNEFIELNRMAFADWMPRNGESRCLSVAFRLLRKHYPHLKWVVSFADATQCGDGTIYRAAGFVLTSVAQNKCVVTLPDGYRFAGSTLTGLGVKGGERTRQEVKRRTGILVGGDGKASLAPLFAAGAQWAAGYQLRYVYFLHPEERANLTVPELPYSAIADAGATMYKGKRPLEREACANAGRRCEPDPDAPKSNDTGTPFPGE